MNQDKGYCVGFLWNGSAAETWRAMVLSVALLRATDHDGPGSRIGQAAAAVLCGEGKDCSMEVWHETLLVLFVGRNNWQVLLLMFRS